MVKRTVSLHALIFQESSLLWYKSILNFASILFKRPQSWQYNTLTDEFETFSQPWGRIVRGKGSTGSKAHYSNGDGSWGSIHAKRRRARIKPVGSEPAFINLHNHLGLGHPCFLFTRRYDFSLLFKFDRIPQYFYPLFWWNDSEVGFYNSIACCISKWIPFILQSYVDAGKLCVINFSLRRKKHARKHCFHASHFSRWLRYLFHRRSQFASRGNFHLFIKR